MKKSLVTVLALLLSGSMSQAQQAALPGTSNDVALPFKLELTGDAGEFISGAIPAGVEIVHTNATADLYTEADPYRVAFQIYPFGSANVESDPQRYRWTIIAERRNGQKLRQGQYTDVSGHPAYGSELTFSVRPPHRSCTQVGQSEVRILDSVAGQSGSTIRRFGVTFTLACRNHTKYLRGSFYVNWTGDEPFRLPQSALRANSYSSYSPTSFLPDRAIDASVGTYWIGTYNRNRSFRGWDFHVNQSGSRLYRLSHMDIFYYNNTNLYRPDHTLMNANDGTTYVAGYTPHWLYGQHPTYPSFPKASFDLGNLKLQRVNLDMYGNQYFPVIRQIDVYALPHYSRWQNQANRCDTNGDGRVYPSDALAVINFASRNGYNYVFSENKPLAELFYDLNGDERFTMQDLQIAASCLSQIDD